MEEKNIIMTTRELAEYIKLNEKTIIKMAQNGDIPGIKVGNKWRFRLSAIDNYLQGEVLSKTDDDLDMVIKTGEHIIPLSRLAEPSLMKLNLVAKTRTEVLYELSEIAVNGGLASSSGVLFDQLKKREKLLSTAIGNGIAIPHARNPRIGLRSNKGVNFSAPDNEKVYLFFMICPTNAFVHMRLLAKIAKLLHGLDMVDKLRQAKNKEEITALLLEFERTQFIFPQQEK